MFDLHSHILPGMDDGPSDMEESVEMALMAYRDGIRVMAATPHNRDVVNRSSISHAKALVDELNREMETRSVALKVIFGMENHLEMNTPEQVDRGVALPIEGTRFILIELPFEVYPFHAGETLQKLLSRGFRPIVAHPERNIPIQRSPQLLAGLVSRGVLAQLTAGSLVGSFGETAREVSEELLRIGLVHLIASDCHAAGGDRTPLLSLGVDAAAKVVGERAARRLVDDIPRAMFENRVAAVEELAAPSDGR